MADFNRVYSSFRPGKIPTIIDGPLAEAPPGYWHLDILGRRVPLLDAEARPIAYDSEISRNIDRAMHFLDLATIAPNT